MVLPQLPFRISGYYKLIRPKVPLVVVSHNNEDAEKARANVQLAIEGQPTEITTTTPGGSKLRRFAILNRKYEPLAIGAHTSASATAMCMMRHAEESTFLVVCLDEHKTDKYGVDFVEVREYRHFTIPINKPVNINGKTIVRKTQKKVSLLNRHKCTIEWY